MNEEAFFFDHNGSKLFGFFHIPSGHQSSAAASRGIIFCHPFAEEKNISHRVLIYFARNLCRLGYPVLRFDYRGCGDSEGDFEQATLKTRLSDIGKAIDIFLQRIGIDHVSLFGLRLGATLAALKAEADSRVDSLILWEPIVNVHKYFDQYLRTRIVAESTWSGRVTKTRKDLIRELESGRCVDVLSYNLSPQCFEEFTKLDVLGRIGSFQGPVLVVGISKQQRTRKELDDLIQVYRYKGASLQFVLVQDRPFWIDPNDPIREIRSWQDHDDLFNQTVNWMTALNG